MIVKETTIILSKEEIESPIDIELKFNVISEEGYLDEEGNKLDITYTITYPKT